MGGIRARNPHEPSFYQAVESVLGSVMPLCLEQPEYLDRAILERLTEPDRIIRFRVTWQDDRGRVHVNRGWRVQHSNCLGPYKGGLRFRNGVSDDVFRFLAFEQTLKNSLTGQPMGGAKGGSDFDPRGRSDDEVLRFCQSFMVGLIRHIGPDVDVPAGDVGVGNREIGYLFGHYMRLSNAWSGVLTGKGCAFGGSAGRTEATGYGCVDFCRHALEHAGETIAGKRIAISGAGTVALYAAEKALEQDALVVSLSDSSGMIRFPQGLDATTLPEIKDWKRRRRRSLEEYAEAGDGVEFHAASRPWKVDCDIAMPCATENELNADDADGLITNGTGVVCEGANMPCTTAAKQRFAAAGVLFLPGKAANAGGVAVSGLEQSQNAMRLSWSRDRVDRELDSTMRRIHDLCVEHGRGRDGVDYDKGANVAAFLKLANAMTAYGVT